MSRPRNVIVPAATLCGFSIAVASMLAVAGTEVITSPVVAKTFDCALGASLERDLAIDAAWFQDENEHPQAGQRNNLANLHPSDRKVWHNQLIRWGG